MSVRTLLLSDHDESDIDGVSDSTECQVYGGTYNTSPGLKSTTITPPSPTALAATLALVVEPSDNGVERKPSVDHSGAGKRAMSAGFATFVGLL